MNNKITWSVAKHSSEGYVVTRNGKPLEAVFKYKNDALIHKRNLKKFSDAIAVTMRKITWYNFMRNKVVRVSTRHDGDFAFAWEELYGIQYIRTVVYIKYWWSKHLFPIFTYVKIEKEIPIFGVPHIVSNNDEHIRMAMKNRPIVGYDKKYIVCKLDRWIDGVQTKISR